MAHSVEGASQGRRKFTGSPATVTGEVMITVGLLLGLLVVWELFWTDVGANRQQNEVVASLGQEWDHAGVPLIFPDQPDSASQYPLLPDDARQSPDDAPALPYPDRIGRTFATMYVPRWGQKYIKPISEGVSRSQVLDTKGIGHYPKTQMPGEVGNFAVAAHRTTYGKPFTNIQELRAGDAVIIRTENYWFVYKVTGHKIVYPHDISVIQPNPYGSKSKAGGHYLTMTSCHPRFSALQRYVVHGTLEYWAYATDGYPREMFANKSEVA